MAIRRDWISGVCANICRVNGSTERPLIFLVMVPGTVRIVSELCDAIVAKAHADHRVLSEQHRLHCDGFFELKLGGCGLGLFAEGPIARAQQLPLFTAGVPSVINDETRAEVNRLFTEHALEVFCGEAGDEVATEDTSRLALGILRRERENDSAASARQAELARWIVEELLTSRGMRRRGVPHSVRPKGALTASHILELLQFNRECNVP